MDLHSLLIECAHEAGFPLAGTVDIDLAFSDSGNQSILKHVERYDEWIQSGFAGAMEYLVRGRDRRANPRLLFPPTQSILCVGLPYPRRTAGAQTPSQGARYARYIQGSDYHNEIAKKLEQVMENVKARWSSTEPLSWKVCVDTSAVLERSWAALAGLGWIGKNKLLIHPKYGSYLFLAEVLISQKTHQAPKPLPSYCGNCRRCLESCPPQAFEKDNLLNANRCISYWTLEKRGSLGITSQDQEKIGTWIAGCDICQEVCPFNIKPTREEEAKPAPVFINNATQLNSWQKLLLETQDQYKQRVKNSSLNRVKTAQFSRNLAMNLINVFSQLDPTESAALRESLRSLIIQRYEQETDEVASELWRKCAEIVSPAGTYPIPQTSDQKH